MKNLLFAFFVSVCLSSCKDEKIVEDTSGVETFSTDATMAADDDVAVKKELAQLVRKTMHWAESDQSFNLLPVIIKGSICTRFDYDKHNENICKLKATCFFAQEFISNYDAIIKTLDSKIISGEFEVWNVYELPTFIFSNDVDPWCMCQDVPGDWNNLKIGIKELNDTSGRFFYYFGEELPSDGDYKYDFNAINESGIWKISYMYGFDFENSVTKDGELK